MHPIFWLKLLQRVLFSRKYTHLFSTCGYVSYKTKEAVLCKRRDEDRHHLLLLHNQMHDKSVIAKSQHAPACVRWAYFQEKYPRDYGTIWSLYEFLITQIQSNSSHQSLPVCLQSFLVETWSDCSGSAHHHGPYMLEPTIVNSTATLVIPSLPSECHITARIHSQISSSNITFG